MKNSHIYERMNNNQVIRIYSNILKTNEEHVARELFANITEQAHDHPKYNSLKEVYDKRFGIG